MAGKKGAKEKCGVKTTSEEKDGELEELCQSAWKCTRALYSGEPKKLVQEAGMQEQNLLHRFWVGGTAQGSEHAAWCLNVVP